MKAVGMMLIAFMFSVSMACACSDKVSNKAEHQTHIVEIKNFSFVPDEINVAQGDKVIWINRDTINHNIVDSSTEVTLSQTLAKGDEFSYIVKENMNYACGFHPSMTGVVQLRVQ